MRRIAVFLATIALLAAPAVVLAAEEFSAQLSGAAEVPPVSGDGSGSASVTISDDESEITYEVSYENLSGPAAAAHIHYGAADVAGGVILPLEVGDSPFSGTLTEADFTPLDGGPQTFAEALTAIQDGNTYVNIHTEANPGGEIRGQLTLVLLDTPEPSPPDTATDPSAGELAGTMSPWLLILLVVAAAGALLAVRLLTTRRA